LQIKSDKLFESNKLEVVNVFEMDSDNIKNQFILINEE